MVAPGHRIVDRFYQKCLVVVFFILFAFSYAPNVLAACEKPDNRHQSYFFTKPTVPQIVDILKQNEVSDSLSESFVELLNPSLVQLTDVCLLIPIDSPDSFSGDGGISMGSLGDGQFVVSVLKRQRDLRKLLVGISPNKDFNPSSLSGLQSLPVTFGKVVITVLSGSLSPAEPYELADLAPLANSFYQKHLGPQTSALRFSEPVMLSGSLAIEKLPGIVSSTFGLLRPRALPFSATLGNSLGGLIRGEPIDPWNTSIRTILEPSTRHKIPEFPGFLSDLSIEEISVEISPSPMGALASISIPLSANFRQKPVKLIGKSVFSLSESDPSLQLSLQTTEPILNLFDLPQLDLNTPTLIVNIEATGNSKLEVLSEYEIAGHQGAAYVSVSQASTDVELSFEKLTSKHFRQVVSALAPASFPTEPLFSIGDIREFRHLRLSLSGGKNNDIKVATSVSGQLPIDKSDRSFEGDLLVGVDASVPVLEATLNFDEPWNDAFELPWLDLTNLKQTIKLINADIEISTEGTWAPVSSQAITMMISADSRGQLALAGQMDSLDLSDVEQLIKKIAGESPFRDSSLKLKDFTLEQPGVEIVVGASPAFTLAGRIVSDLPMSDMMLFTRRISGQSSTVAVFRLNDWSLFDNVPLLGNVLGGASDFGALAWVLSTNKKELALSDLGRVAATYLNKLGIDDERPLSIRPGLSAIGKLPLKEGSQLAELAQHLGMSADEVFLEGTVPGAPLGLAGDKLSFAALLPAQENTSNEPPWLERSQLSVRVESESTENSLLLDTTLDVKFPDGKDDSGVLRHRKMQVEAMGALSAGTSAGFSIKGGVVNSAPWVSPFGIGPWLTLEEIALELSAQAKKGLGFKIQAAGEMLGKDIDNVLLGASFSAGIPTAVELNARSDSTYSTDDLVALFSAIGPEASEDVLKAIIPRVDIKPIQLDETKTDSDSTTATKPITIDFAFNALPEEGLNEKYFELAGSLHADLSRSGEIKHIGQVDTIISPEKIYFDGSIPGKLEILSVELSNSQIVLDVKPIALPPSAHLYGSGYLEAPWSTGKVYIDINSEGVVLAAVRTVSRMLQAWKNYLDEVSGKATPNLLSSVSRLFDAFGVSNPEWQGDFESSLIAAYTKNPNATARRVLEIALDGYQSACDRSYKFHAGKCWKISPEDAVPGLVEWVCNDGLFGHPDDSGKFLCWTLDPTQVTRLDFTTRLTQSTVSAAVCMWRRVRNLPCTDTKSSLYCSGESWNNQCVVERPRLAQGSAINPRPVCLGIERDGSCYEKGAAPDTNPRPAVCDPTASFNGKCNLSVIQPSDPSLCERLGISCNVDSFQGDLLIPLLRSAASIPLAELRKKPE